MNQWIPDRKVIAGGLTGLVGWALTLILARWGIILTPDQSMALVGALSGLAAYLVPPAQRDILRHLNDQIVAIAQDDPRVPVTKPPAGK